jgi:hypothetical protein
MVVIPDLRTIQSKGAAVSPATAEGGRLEIPAGVRGQYRLAQLDDYGGLSRRDFPWTAPLRLRLAGRASAGDLPGTWGFGLWNDPFSLSLGLGGGARRLPALPNAAWFFHASAENHLSFRNDRPAQGFIAQTFESAALPALLLASGSPLLPLLAWPRTGRLVRAVLGRLIGEDSAAIPADVTQWHTYSLHWTRQQVCFEVDGQVVLQSQASPRGRMGLVIWIDNQYAAFPPSGRLAYGTLENREPAWIEVKEIQVEA